MDDDAAAAVAFSRCLTYGQDSSQKQRSFDIHSRCDGERAFFRCFPPTLFKFDRCCIIIRHHHRMNNARRKSERGRRSLCRMKCK